MVTNVSENKDKVDQSVLCFNFPSFELTHRTKSHLNIYVAAREGKYKIESSEKYVKIFPTYRNDEMNQRELHWNG